MTGFTYPIVQDGIDFRTFALSCTAAFGPLFVDGKLPPDKQVPKVIQSTWRQERLAQAEADFSAYTRLTLKQRIAKAKRDIKASIASNKKSAKEVRAENRKLQHILDQVEAWQVPTPDHRRFKEYMVDQLTGSMGDLSYYDKSLKELRKQSPEALVEDEMAFLAKRVRDAREDAMKELQLNTFNQKWVDALFEALPAPRNKIRRKSK